MKKFFKDFSEFIFRGNVVELAIAVAIGAAFNQIVSSIVGNIISPFIGFLMADVNLSDLVFKIGTVEIGYGVVLNAIINFIVTAFVLFIIIKLMQHSRAKFIKEKEKEIPKKSSTDVLLEEIRDLLKEK